MSVSANTSYLNPIPIKNVCCVWSGLDPKKWQNLYSALLPNTAVSSGYSRSKFTSICY